jgi:hypothetical protein
MESLLEQRLWLGAVLCTQGLTSFATVFDQLGLIDGGLLWFIQYGRRR